MVSLFPRRFRDKIWPEALPPAMSFDTQTVLVTGATAGLGLAAAVHFATLGAKVIMTSRDLSKGMAAQEHVEQCASIVGQGKIRVMQLDMSRYSSCLSFVDQLKQSETSNTGLDVAILNAGLINADYVCSPEGWEETLQVHVLSTTLLGLLLLDWMKQKYKCGSKASHLIFVTSRKHLLPDITAWEGLSAGEGILRHFSDERNWPSGQIDPNYSETKLMLTYAVEQICKRAVGTEQALDVLVNTVCPGLVSTRLGHQISRKSWLMQLLIPMYFGILGKSADYGARSYVIAARVSEHEHGRYIQSLYTDDEYYSLAIPNRTSDVAVKVGRMVWNEIITELRAKVPALKEMGISA